MVRPPVSDPSLVARTGKIAIHGGVYGVTQPDPTIWCEMKACAIHLPIMAQPGPQNQGVSYQAG